MKSLIKFVLALVMTIGPGVFAQQLLPSNMVSGTFTATGASNAIPDALYGITARYAVMIPVGAGTFSAVIETSVIGDFSDASTCTSITQASTFPVSCGTVGSGLIEGSKSRLRLSAISGYTSIIYSYFGYTSNVSTGGGGVPTPGGSGLCLVSNGGSAGDYVWGSCSGSSSAAFSALTGSTNNGGNAMIVGSTSSLDYSGTGTIDANYLLTHALPSLTTGYLNWTGSAWALNTVSATPGSPPTSVQFNNSGAFAGSANFEYSATAGITLIQGANNTVALSITRATDTSPTGNFLQFQNAAANANLFIVDMSGNITGTSLTTTGSGGGSWTAVEGTCPSGVSSSDILCADSTGHRWGMENNNGSEDFVLGRATTDTLTNKTYDTAGTGNSFKINGTAITAVTGTGSAVLAVSPALTGTPDASGATQFKLPVNSTATTLANGEFKYDTTNSNWHVWGNAVDNYAIIMPATITPNNNDCAKFTVASNVITLNTAGATCGSGSGGSAGADLFLTTADAGPNNSSTETSLMGTVVGSKTIAANTLGNNAVNLDVSGYLSTPAVPDSLTVKFYLDSTAICTATYTPTANISSGTFSMHPILVARGTGAGGTVVLDDIFANTGTTLAPNDTTCGTVGTAVSIDFTQSHVFDVKAKWNAAQSGELIKGSTVQGYIGGAPVISVDGQTGAVTLGSNNHGVVLHEGATTQPVSVAAGSNGQQFDAAGASADPVYRDYYHPYVLPAANDVAGTAGNGWSTPSSNGCVLTAKSGTNVQTGTFTCTTSQTVQTWMYLSQNWDTGVFPYVRFDILSTDTTNGHTLIPTVSVSCVKGDGTASYDQSFQTAQAGSTLTIGASGVSGGEFTGSSVQLNSTSMTNCIAGSKMYFKFSYSGSATATDFELAGIIVTVPELNIAGAQ